METTKTIANGAAISGAIDIQALITGSLTTPATLDATTVIAFKASPAFAGTYTPVYDNAGALSTITAALNASGSYDIPNIVMKCNFIKIWTCTTAGVDVNQTGDKTFSLVCKG